MSCTKKRCGWIKLAVAAFAILLICKIGYDLKWFDVAIGIARLEGDKSRKVHKVSFKSLSFVTLAESQEEIFDEMEKMGWSFFKNYGRGYIFTKDGYEVLLTRRNVLNRYTFYEVASKDVFDVI